MGLSIKEPCDISQFVDLNRTVECEKMRANQDKEKG